MVGEGMDVLLSRVSLLGPATSVLGSAVCTGVGRDVSIPALLPLGGKEGLKGEGLGREGSVETVGRLWNQEGNEVGSGQS